jgi:hypothetical protein
LVNKSRSTCPELNLFGRGVQAENAKNHQENLGFFVASVLGA